MFNVYKHAWRSARRQVTLAEIAQTELANTERDLLRAHTAKEQADATIAEFQARIKRLKAYINEKNREANPG